MQHKKWPEWKPKELRVLDLIDFPPYLETVIRVITVKMSALSFQLVITPCSLWKRAQIYTVFFCLIAHLIYQLIVCNEISKGLCDTHFVSIFTCVCVCVCSSPGYRGLEQQHTHWAPLKLQLAFSSVQSSFFLRETHSYVEMAQILTKPLQTRRICLRVRKRTQVMPCSVGLTMLGVVCECVCVYLYKGMQFCSGLLGVDEITANCVTP